MGQLMNDIVSTADAFTSNFSDKGPFDYSIESLVLVDNLLEELSDYEWDEDNLYSLELWRRIPLGRKGTTTPFDSWIARFLCINSRMGKG